jgi:hypothetical protein
VRSDNALLATSRRKVRFHARYTNAVAARPFSSGIHCKDGFAVTDVLTVLANSKSGQTVLPR